MNAIVTMPLECRAAKRKLDTLGIPPHDMLALTNMLDAIDSVSDSRHLELVMAEAAGLLRGLFLGLVLTQEQVAEVGGLFEAVAEHERTQKN